MATQDDILQQIQKALGPYIRLREETANIRRLLALQLDSSLHDASAAGPLSLVVPSKPASSSAARGLQREYLEALNANLRAREEFQSCVQENNYPRTAPAEPEGPKVDYLQEHLATIRLQKKHERLLAVEKHLSQLSQKPAALPEFLDPEEAFVHCRPLPAVPKDVVTALALNDTPATTHIKDLIDQLEKHVLRAKLLLKREEQLLEDVKSRLQVKLDQVDNSAKVGALNVTRAELINWIEAELAKAGDETGADGEDSSSPTKQDQGASNATQLDEQLTGVRAKYKHYLEGRKLLLQLVNQHSKPVIKPHAEPTVPTTESVPTSLPSTHLLSPYVEQLLSIAHEQKGLITQKSHLNTTIAKQLKDKCQVLDHLADESQLLPAHPMPGAPGRKPAGFGDALSSSETPNSSSRVRPWVFAADSAKIAALEAVAEKIEEGQLALEESLRTIGGIGQLLGPRTKMPDVSGEEVGNTSVEEDIWMTESRPSGKNAGTKKQAIHQRTKSRATSDVWDALDGNLGLLGSDGDCL
ncbi:hypothetical protein OQA88_6748 [Cercophora sp. LCS_1]